MPISNPTFCEFRDEGIKQGVSRILDFTGAGVSVTVAAGVATVNVPGGAAGSLTLTTVEKDLGALASKDGTFDITGLSGLTADKQVLVNQAVAVYTGKGTLKDEAEMNQCYAAGYVLNTTTIRVYWHCGHWSNLKGNVKFNYAVSA